jgi:hypothetical protein
VYETPTTLCDPKSGTVHATLGAQP